MSTDDPRDDRSLIGRFSNRAAAPSVYLVDRPITFGHAQLVFTGGEGKREEELFDAVSQVIVKAIGIFSTKLAGLIDEYPELASYTSTRGHYKKTLVLRASANEEDDEYKVHLVPYFESHEDLCVARYRAIHDGLVARGGLLGWVGDRETEVDRCGGLPDYPFRVTELARRLRND